MKTSTEIKLIWRLFNSNWNTRSHRYHTYFQEARTTISWQRAELEECELRPRKIQFRSQSTRIYPHIYNCQLQRKIWAYSPILACKCEGPILSRTIIKWSNYIYIGAPVVNLRKQIYLRPKWYAMDIAMKPWGARSHEHYSIIDRI